MDGDEEFFDAVTGERTEDPASRVQPGLTRSPREVRTPQESHRRELCAVPRPPPRFGPEAPLWTTRDDKRRQLGL